MATKDYIIAPSILSADFSCLGEEVNSVLEAGADWVHFDVMDNHYVPNLTIGPMVCQSLRDYGITAPIDVHLMVEPVDQLIKSFSKAGATYITFHPEASDDVDRSLDLIKDSGCKAGLVLNPDIPIEVLDGFLDKLDMILLMSVFPGFGGQEFIDSVLEKVTTMRSIINENSLETRLEIDGGIKLKNIKEVADAGADTFVSGSAIFGQPDYSEIIQKMRASLKAKWLVKIKTKIPVSREILADMETPLSVYRKLANGPYSYLFESVEGGENWARYSLIGLEAAKIISIKKKGQSSTKMRIS